MGKIVAVGGGEIGRPGTTIETKRIDEEIIRLTGKTKPTLLFLPTASKDSQGYVDVVKQYFGKRLGVNVEVLYLYDTKQRIKDIESQILNCDINYVGGGNTLAMMTKWRELNVDNILKKAFDKGIILSGVSAGAICWASYGLSDSRSMMNTRSKDLMRVRGLDLLKMTISPHQIREPYRLYELMSMIKKTSGIGLALDDCAALEVINDKYRIIHSKTTSGAYKIYKKKGRIFTQRLFASKEFNSLSDLLEKS